MLKDPVAKSAADLVGPEKELAHAQGDVEATIAQRDYLGTITETVRVDIAVTTTAVGGRWSHLVNEREQTLIEN